MARLVLLLVCAIVLAGCESRIFRNKTSEVQSIDTPCDSVWLAPGSAARITVDTIKQQCKVEALKGTTWIWNGTIAILSGHWMGLTFVDRGLLERLQRDKVTAARASRT